MQKIKDNLMTRLSLSPVGHRGKFPYVRPRTDFGLKRANLRSHMYDHSAYYRPERAEYKPWEVDLWPKRADIGPKMANFGSERANFRPERGDCRSEKVDLVLSERISGLKELDLGQNVRGGGMDGRTDGRQEIHPWVLQDIGPLGPLPIKSETNPTY